jgi:hypothetical protein
MRFFLDTEFMEDGRTIDLVSIALVRADGMDYYAEASHDPTKANDWVKTHVFPHLRPDRYLKPKDVIRSEILAFVGPEKPEFWGYYADYDWVAFCQLFGRMVDLPKGWPKYCMDLKQFAKDLGDPELPKQAESQEHHALSDARWNRETWVFLEDRRARLGFLLQEWLDTPFFEKREAWEEWVRDFRPRVYRALQRS